MSTAAQRAAFREGTRLLFEELAYKPGDEFALHSRSRDNIEYSMTVTPEGCVVHQDEGCEGEQFNGVGGCYHSQESEKFVTQAVTVHQGTAIVPTRIEFDQKQLDTIAKVICVDSDGHAAPAPFVELFLAACRHSGLDPFLRQIYALKLQNRWTMYVGVDGYRVIAERTGLMEGMDGPQWSDDGEEWFDYPFSDDPAYCRVGVWRKGVPRAFTAVVTMKSRRNPNSKSWKDDAPGMLAKCTEILALRRAFPADMAVIPQDAVFEDVDGAPVTKAEVPTGEWHEVVATPVSEEQLKAIRKLWNPKHPNIEKVRSVNGRAFPMPEPGASNNPRLLSYDEASTVIGLLSEKPETPASREAGDGAGQAKADTSPACTHPDAVIDPVTTLMTCPKCGPIEGPDAQVKQEAMI